MDEHVIPPAHEPSEAIADASSLFHDAGQKGEKSPRHEQTPVDAGGSYDIQDTPEGETIPGRSMPIGPSTTKKAPLERSGMRMEPSEAVEHVWTRWGEWGGTITALAIAAGGLFMLIYLLLSWDVYGLAFFMFLAGVVFLSYLAYPIMITLERPVRVTPEQAVKDYYAALSHHFPHYRRMWLLLGDRGKVDSSFASFEGFKGYWNKKLADLRLGKASGMTPLRFSVDDFRSPKSSGLSSIEASYTVHVSVRGKQDSGPIHSIKVKASLVKGPDRMWYLDHGTLP